MDKNQTLSSNTRTNFQGLTTEEAQQRFLTYGANEIVAKKRKSYLIQFLEEFKNLMVIILLVATVVAFILGETIDAFIIFFIILLNAFIGFLQKFKAEKAIEALKKLIAPTAKVLRDGKMHKIPARDLVPGDILILEEGDQIGADAVLFEENELETQESALTGESTSVIKNAFQGKFEDLLKAENVADKDAQENSSYAAENLIYMGTAITHGTGKALVLRTGMQTEMGKIAKLTTETQKDKSPLEKELDTIGLFVGKITLAITAVLFLYGFLLQHREFVETLLFSISVAVAAVPEGLPTTITIALAIGVQKLARNKAIVKQLSSVETLGATTVICSDKTGTLTKNEMTVKELYFDNFHAKVTGVGYAPNGDIHIEHKGTSTILSNKNGEKDFIELQEKSPGLYQSLALLLQSAGFCNNATVQKKGFQDEKSPQKGGDEKQEELKNYEMIGDPTEGALMTLVLKSGFNFAKHKNQFEKIHEYPFDSSRKCMTVLMREKGTGKIFAFTKGAPQNILNISSHVYLNQKAIKLDDGTKEDFMNKNEEMAQKALRVLAFAYKELTIHEQKAFEKATKSTKNIFPKETIEQGLTFLGLAGMIDPPRPEVKDAISLCHKAGMRVFIITGDYGATAKAIGEQLSLFNGKEGRVISGQELDALKDSELKKLLKQKNTQLIFARVSPEHKLRIVSALIELKEVVAVTGDGVNDAPALKRADIGVAMGSGTDVSKEASNMILADDSFSTIVKAVQEGRTIYENLKKFIFFIFSSNIGELFTIFLALLLGLPSPLTAIMILSINLFTDILPALALSVEPTTHDVMLQKPRLSKEKILNTSFVKRIAWLGMWMGIIVIGLFIFQLYDHGWSFGKAVSTDDLIYKKASTMAFVLLVMIQMANAFNAKHEKMSLFQINIFNNWKLLGAIVLSIILAILMVEWPVLQPFIHTVPLDFKDWMIVSIGALLIIIVEEIRKYFARKQNMTLKSEAGKVAG